MNLHRSLLILSTLLVVSGAASASDDSDRTLRVRCDAGASLQMAVNRAEPGSRIIISGTCLGPVTITRNGLTLDGLGQAAIDGQKHDALTILGAQNVTVENIDIKNGSNGLVENNGAQATLKNVTVHDNAVMGIQLEANSSLLLSGGSSRKNALNGIDVEASSSLIVADKYTAESNGVFGLNINTSSSLTFTQAHLTVDGNILGIQIGTSSGAFISDSDTTLSIFGNATTGLTIVSGAHMVAFGGTITSQGNGVHGISIDSKAGFDLDAAALVDSHDNVGDGVHLEETSVLTMFNTPAFSGAPGVTTLKTYNNGGNGISVLTVSNLTVIHQAAIDSTGNKGDGILVDNGSQLTLLGSTVTGNSKDILLTFGSRGDITTSAVGDIACDATVLLRGDTGVTCPHP